MKALTAVLSLMALFPVVSDAQYVLDAKASFVHIKGTSTLHDWTASVKKIKATLQAEVEDNQLVKIHSVEISMPSTSLKSGKSALDKNMHKALKTDKYPEITYQLKSHTIHNGAITTIGALTITGVTKNIETKVTQKEVGKLIEIDGEVKLKMSDFNIKPPEYFLGTLKTGNNITIAFHFSFRENN
jgi:polyisoprenoid-binding protein YceI